MPVPLYPLRFEPIFKTMLWGGTRLRPFLNHPPSDDLTGEAWLLSDVDGSPSRVANGALAGKTLRELMAKYGADLLGDAQPINGRFPLLLKLIDARQELSVQVHPTDEQARAKNPTAAGKTEAWLILEANEKTSRIYAGFQPGMTEQKFRAAMACDSVPGTLHQFTPNAGDCVFLPAGTVHAIGADILLFEVQQTSDITYRLFDWNRVDAKTGKPRDLHMDDGLACSNFASGPCHAVITNGESLVECEYFQLTSTTIRKPMTLTDRSERCSAMVVIGGGGTLDGEQLKTGDTLLFPATGRASTIIPDDDLTILTCTPLSSRSDHADRPERRPR